MADDDEYNSEDPKQIKARKADEKNAQKLQVNDLKYLMSLPQFRRFFWHLLKFTKPFEVPRPDETERAAGFSDGGRNIGLRYFGDVQADCLKEYTLMAEEAEKKENAYDD